ncbi:hypothetical protein ANO11243_054010 [Dothideomycetidae sp. 11243]|nr:hypothetical protein ANO11243_054010 [fungal sp. No.11243]
MRGNAVTCRVHYKGKEDDFIVFAESSKAVSDWKSDRSIPLAQVVNGWKIFVSHGHGNQGVLDTASKSTMENEFGSHNEDEVIKAILEKGNIVESQSAARQGETNISDGGKVGH